MIKGGGRSVVVAGHAKPLSGRATMGKGDPMGNRCKRKKMASRRILRNFATHNRPLN
jgi:hypothetical protein